jgi:hypothetical protein
MDGCRSRAWCGDSCLESESESHLVRMQPIPEYVNMLDQSTGAVTISVIVEREKKVCFHPYFYRLQVVPTKKKTRVWLQKACHCRTSEIVDYLSVIITSAKSFLCFVFLWFFLHLSERTVP